MTFSDNTGYYIYVVFIYNMIISQEPFDPEEFVERLAWRTVDSNREEGNSSFDPVLMHETFSQAIK